MMHIMAGALKGRRLLPPPGGSDTRPITSLAKKSLFDILSPRLASAQVVVDLYCGTGTMGLEALSRGARRCWFAEWDRHVLDRLRRNIESLGVGDRCKIWRGDILSQIPAWMKKLPAPIDVAFVDPPYADARQWDWQQIGQKLFAPLVSALSADGLVTLRTPGRAKPPEQLAGLEVRRSKTYGDMHVTILGRAESTQQAIEQDG